MAVVSMNYLLEAGVHFGHQKRKWNPKMKEYIFNSRDDIYIIDLEKTSKKLEECYAVIKEIAEKEGTFLFVGTKKQAKEAVKENALKTDNFYVSERWLGGTLTNFKTIRSRVNRLNEIEKMEEEGTFELLTKKEVLGLKKEYAKLLHNLEGIRNMKRLPSALIVVDPCEEIIAIREARKLNIPVIGLVDTNCDPDLVDYIVPANDDAVRSVSLLLSVLTNAICEVKGLEMVDVLSDEENKAEKAYENKEQPSVKEASVKENNQTSVDYASMTVAELKERAKEAGISGISAMKKAELVKALEEK